MSEIISDKDYIRMVTQRKCKSSCVEFTPESVKCSSEAIDIKGQKLNKDYDGKQIFVLRANVLESIKALMKPFIDLRKSEESPELSSAYEIGVQDTIGVLESMFSASDKRKMLIYQKRIGDPKRVRFEKLTDVIKEIQEGFEND